MKHIYNKMALVLVMVAFIALQAEGQVKSQLNLADIMKGNEWVGNQPEQIEWYNQSESVYFSWNRENRPTADLYSYNFRTRQLAKVETEARESLLTYQMVYSNDGTKRLFQKGGNLFVEDVKSGKSTQLSNTLDPIVSPRFSADGKEVIYQSGTNLFKRDIQTGFVTQFTDFRSGSAGAGGAGMSLRQGVGATTGGGGAAQQGVGVAEQDRWLREQQSVMFDYFKVRQERQASMGSRPRGAQGNQASASERPRTVNLGDGGAAGIDICPKQRFVTYNTYERPATTSKNTIVPNYITASGYVENIDSRSKVGSPSTVVGLSIYDTEKRTSYKVKTSDIPGIRDVPKYKIEDYGFAGTEYDEDRKVNVSSVVWSADGSYAVVNVTSHDYKDRWIMLLNPETGDLSLLDRQHDEAWIGGPGSRQTGFMPDNRRIWFQSEESGYSHLYTIDVMSGQKSPLTAGEFEIYSPEISKDRKWWYFSSNEVHPGERHFYRMPLNGGARTQITVMTGSNDVSLSPDEKWIAMLYSYSNRPWEIYVMENKPGAAAVQVTQSVSEEFKGYAWRDPEVLTFPADDGENVWARLYKPEESVKNGAAVIFVHGAGYLQNVHKWWSQYFREYMFHNMLVDMGYTVLDIDYRGSSGYGRDWRTGIYRYMGGKDLSDHVDGARFLVEKHGIDPARVGLYGGSYGGFITLMAMFNHPDVFTAGAALRSVTDWAHYNHGYTANILNTPLEDSIAYARSSPINFANGLQGALLMCHGVIDDNVQFQDIIRLSQRLIELGKENWELAVYPVERHAFTEPTSWYDEYRRILKLFNDNLLK
jgi:dipeptidyl aminopeptidase/acylaminoacyl peptidase